MPIFSYKAVDKRGHKKRGRIAGISESEVLSRLRRQELSDATLVDISGSPEVKLLKILNRVKAKDLVIFSRQFAVLISANVPIVESLIILIDQTENITFKELIADLAFDVDSGSFLSDSLAKHKKVFSEFFVSMVRSGETSGKLDEVMNYLADETERNYDMSAKIRGAMIYPIFVLSGLVGVAVVMMIYVIPNLTSILTESNATLPLSTQIVINTSKFMQSYIVYIIIVAAGAFFLLRAFFRTASGRRWLDIAKLRVPIFGPLFKYIYLMRFSRSLSTLLKGGVTIGRSLEITASIVGNTVYKEIIMETLDSINDGNPLSTVMEQSSDVPKMVPQMISVGEKSGKIDLILDRITIFYSREIVNRLDNLSKLIEPLIVVIMGVGVGIMVAAIILPMYNLANQL